MSALELDRVTHRYNDDVAALNDVSLSVRSGELVALVGPSGSGKTTALAIAGGLLRPTSGRVRINDVTIDEERPERLAALRASRVGFIFQSANLTPYLTALDNLIGVDVIRGERSASSRETALGLLDRLGVAGRAGHYPGELSGGERQRVAVARALMASPWVVLADEPTASLDRERGRAVVELIAQQVRERNAGGLLVTHDERVLDLVDRVVRIEDGYLQD